MNFDAIIDVILTFIAENVPILNKTEAEQNYAPFNVMCDIYVNDLKSFNYNGTLLADHFMVPQYIPRVLY